MSCWRGGPDRSVNNYHHPEASFIFLCYITIVVVPSSVNVSAMDRVDSNERRRRLHGGSAEVITLRGEGRAFFRMISSSSTPCIGCLLLTLDEWPNRRKREHNGKNPQKTRNMRVVRIKSQDATDKLTKDCQLKLISICCQTIIYSAKIIWRCKPEKEKLRVTG